MVRLEEKIKQLCRVNNVTQKQLYSAIGVTDAGMRKMYVAYTKKESQPLQLTLQRFTFNNAAKVSISFETEMPAHRLLRILNLKALLSRSDKAVIIR